MSNNILNTYKFFEMLNEEYLIYESRFGNGKVEIWVSERNGPTADWTFYISELQNEENPDQYVIERMKHELERKK